MFFVGFSFGARLATGSMLDFLPSLAFFSFWAEFFPVSEYDMVNRVLSFCGHGALGWSVHDDILRTLSSF